MLLTGYETRVECMLPILFLLLLPTVLPYWLRFQTTCVLVMVTPINEIFKTYMGGGGWGEKDITLQVQVHRTENI